MKHTYERPTPGISRLSLLIVPLIIVLAIVGYLLYTTQRAEREAQVASELAAIADLKLAQITSWRQERMSDANFADNNVRIHMHVRHLVEGRDTEVARTAQVDWMRSMYKNRQYGRIAIFDSRGRVLVAVPQHEDLPGPYAMTLMERAGRERTVLFSDLSTRDGAAPVLDIVVPVFRGDGRKDPMIASVVLRVDPYQTLYPILSHWPIPSATGTLGLLRREGGDVVYLNPLRDTAAAPLSIRLPLASSGLPVGQAIAGATGLLRGQDIRGRAVVAVVRPVPGSPWYLEAALGEAEVYAPVREFGIFVAIVAVLLIAVATAGNVALHRTREADRIRSELEITAERQALARHYEYLTRYANDIVLLFDDTGTIREINTRGETTYGYSREQLLAMQVDALGFWPGGDSEADHLRHELQEDPRETGGVLFESEHRRSDGTVFSAEVSARRLTVEGKLFVHAIVRDISDRKRVEQALIEERDRAEEAGAFQRILLENMSHELRTPMHGILGFAQLLGTSALDDEQKEMVRGILTSGRRLMTTLDEILLLSELEAGTLKPLPEVKALGDLVDQAARSHAHDASAKGLVFRVERVGPEVYVRVDGTLLIRAVEFLVENAIKFTASGEVVLRSGVLPGGPGEHAGVEVRDTGIGIAPEHQEVIFDAFRQVSAGSARGYEGAGLGLTLVRRIADMLGGSLTMESTPGRGSGFTLTFPSVEPPPAPTLTAAAPADAGGSGAPPARPSVLLVEDNYLNAIVATRFLEGTCEVVHMPDGARAIACARGRRFDMILMDIHLGAGMDGVEAVSVIRQLPAYAGIPIAAVTGYTTPADRTRFSAAGMGYFLAKPYDQDDIVVLVGSALGLPSAAPGGGVA